MHVRGISRLAGEHSLRGQERMLPHETVEIRGARRFIDHNMGAARHVKGPAVLPPCIGS